jgi:replication factor A1
MAITSIEQAYEKVKGKISRKDFDKKILDKRDAMNDLVDEVTASLLVVNDIAGAGAFVDGGSETEAMSGKEKKQSTIVNPKELCKIGEIKPAKDISFAGVIVTREEPRSYNKKDGGTGMRCSMMVGDETGKIRLTLWDEKVGEADALAAGDVVEVYDSWAREWNGHVEASLGYRGSIQKSDKKVKHKVKTTKIDKVSPDDVVSIRGIVTGIDGLKEFTRRDGKPGRRCPVWVSDDTGRIRVTFWNEVADQAAALDVGNTILVPDAKAKAGPSGDMELTANNGFIAE